MIASFWSNLRFEMTTRKRLIAPYIYFALLFALTFMMVISSGGAFKGVNVNFGLGQKVFINSPFSINLYYGLLSLFGVLIISPIFGGAVCKDYEAKFDQIVLSTPNQRTGFYLGRFAGALITCTLIYLSIALAHAMASAMPFVQRSLFTSPTFAAYALPYFTILIPSIIIFGSVSFAIGAIAKRMSAVYIASILSFMLYLFGQGFTGDIEKKSLRAMIDPFGLNAISSLTEYWSVLEKNTRLVTLSGPLLLNRALWLAVSLILLALALYFVQKAPRKRKDRAAKKEGVKAEERDLALDLTLDTALSYSVRSRLKLFWSQLLFEAKGSVKNIYFVCLALAGIIFMFAVSGQSGKIFGTETYPITYKVLETSSGSLGLFITIIMIFYTGELLWRDRQSRMSLIIDATPVPVWVSSLAKFAALQVITGALLLAIAICGVIIQTAKGYYSYELGQVFTTLYSFEFVEYLIMSALIFAIHTVADNKYVGHAVAVLYLILTLVIVSAGFEHVMYRYGSATSGPTYSDMNHYGPFVLRIRMMQLYWGLAAALLLCLVYLFWMRGSDTMWGARIKEAKSRFRGPVRGLVAVLLVGFIAQGSYVFYNTNVLNTYRTSKEGEKDRLAYEITYKGKYEGKDQLMVTKVNAVVDLFPERLGIKANVLYTFANKGQAAVEEMFLNLPLEKKYLSLAFNREAKLEVDDERLDVQIYRFAAAVQPGETVELRFGVDHAVDGFGNDATSTAIAGNGTFINNSSYFPSFGYSGNGELSSDKTREQYGLKPKPRMPPITDESARKYNYLTGRDADWIDFEATVSTDADQIAIAPGYLQRDWVEGGRHYFQYKMDQKILNFYSFLSARYEVKKDRWRDVNLEIYYQKGHEYNLDSMMAASKAGLEYFSENFGPYQSKQFRILEFPRYASFAQSFPNTIPFSEAIGFTAKVDPKDPEDLDYPYYVTAHELAHQWWGHQIVGANVQGATLLSETLAQYSALMVMERKYGRDKMERFLRHEMDAYLASRSGEEKVEQPLALNEHQQYVHYNKGSVVMFALKEEVGEKALNAAIRRFADKMRYQKAPFTTSPEFVATLKESLDPKFHGLIDDMLSKITLYDNRVLSQALRQEADGSYTITLGILGRKLYVNDKGDEEEAPMKQEFVISLKDKGDAVLSSERVMISSGQNTLKFKSKVLPKSVSLDALGIWIDKNRDDNKIDL